MTAETYSFSLGAENFRIPSTVGYEELISTLGIQIIDLILAYGNNSSWEELVQQSKNTRLRTGHQTLEDFRADTIMNACKQLSLSQGRYSINQTE
ncbi:hypothetical protein KBD71_04935 [Candidatus Woesebacteria bacterium]|nr:hypothetical protein [Candidatus Woesebacteria bacterium]